MVSDPHDAARAPMGDALVGDIHSMLQAIVDHVRPADRPSFAPRGRPAQAEPGTGPLSPETVFDIVAEVAPSDAIYVNDSPSTTKILWERLPMEQPGSYFYTASGGLGFAMPAGSEREASNTSVVKRP
jgi:benzoylformate decarboxylase